jgi:ATP-dependent Lon protease
MSILSNLPVRRDVAMTGELTLSGRVLPIGGLKEKLIAAARVGCKTVLIPKDNEKDLEDVPKEILDTLNIKCVETLDEVLAVAIVRETPKKRGKK